MKIKDYLHLYLGCEVEYDDRIGIIYTYYHPAGKYSTNKVWVASLEDSNDPEMSCCASANEVKLILRPLSDMTEEESVELFKSVSNFDLNDCVFDIIDDEDSFCINAELNGRVIDAMLMSINSDIVEMMNNDGSFSPLNPQAQAFNFFLSKHFDLFNLIESGLAIDKTTLK